MAISKLPYPYCIFDTDNFTLPVYVDDRFLEMTGFTAQDRDNGLIPFESLIPAQDCDEIKKEIIRCRDTGENYVLRHEMTKKDGSIILVNVHGSFFEKDGKRYISAVYSNYSRQEKLINDNLSYQKQIEVLTSDVVGGVAIVYADDFSIYRCNNEFRSMLGVGVDETVPAFTEFGSLRDMARVLDALSETVKTNTPFELEVQMHVDNRDKWFRLVGRYYEKLDDRALVFIIAYDITNEKKMYAEIEMQAARYRLITKSVDEIFIEYNVKDDIMEFSNSINRYGDGVVEDFYAQHKSKAFIHEEDFPLFRETCRSLLARSYNCEIELRTKSFDDDYTWYKLSLTSVMDENMTVSRIYGMMSNIQNTKELSKRLEMDNEYINYLITTDSVTGMLNYKTFTSKAEEILQKRDKDHIYGFVYSDINGFSFVNDNLGFEAGNKMLKGFGEIIKNTPTNVIACRIYSDYFVGLYKAKSLAELVDSIKKRNEEFFNQKQKLLPGSNLTVCAGVYVWDEGTEVSRAVFNANLARKSVKGIAHSNDCGVYDPQMHIKRAREQKIANELSSAIESGLIEMFLQPKFSMETMEVIGAEALARWRNPDGTYIMPGEFISVLEKVGYIDELDFYIYDQVLKTLSDWKMAGKRIIPVSVNFSRQHVRSGEYVDKIIEMAKEYEVSPEYIEIEITESCFGDNIDKLFRDMSKLQEAGFRIDIDDFGVSYSTLGVLLNAPVDVVKIDKTFIDEIETDERERMYVKNICQLISTMDKDLIFEGVETKQQAQILCEIGYTKAQGWLFDKAIPVTVFNEKYMK